ncbi:MAG: spoVB, partial [Firmicutes bacterium]|nr:spoVB [Bacillota bacterium]
MKPENFMRGAMMITVGALIARILGAVYRPVAQHFLGDQGLGLVTGPAQAYQVMLAISATGLNVAISRLVSERLALEDYLGARRIFRVASRLLMASGIVGSLFFLFGARWMARVMAVPEAWVGFMVLSPAIFLVTLECIFRGLYQGMQRMAPSAISQVVEQVGRVLLGLVFVAVLSRLALNYGAAAFNGGNTIGVLLGALYGGWIYLRDRPTAGWTTTAPGVRSFEGESTGRLVGKILSIALPLSLIGSVLPITGLVDASVVTNQLIKLGQSSGAAQEALAYLVNAGQLRDLPTILTTALYVSLVPAVTESYATGRLDQARYRATTAFRLTYLFGIPATVGLLVGARDAYSVLFTGPGFAVMAPLAWSTIFLMTQQTSSGVLQGMGFVWTSVQNLLA